MSQIVETIEDCLQEHRVFRNPFTGTTCHSDSYGTAIDFSALNAIPLDKFPKNEWVEAIEYWLVNPNVGPILRIVARTMQRRLGVQA